MAQIVTITNPLTGQPAQVDQLEHTAQQIDDAIARALPGGAIDIALANNDPRNWGLGTDAVDAPDHDANNINTSGLFRAYLNCPIDGAGWWLIKSEKFNTDKYQWAIHYRSSGGYSVDIIAFRSCVAGVYQPWEFLNPPMVLGVEYRTTERYNGKPVYAKAVKVSVLPSAGSYVAPDHAIANFGYCVECCGSLVNGTSIPYVNINREGQILLGVNSNGIRIYSDIDLSALTAVVKIKYTKTTD